MDIQSLRFSDNLLLYYTYIFGLFVGLVDEVDDCEYCD